MGAPGFASLASLGARDPRLPLFFIRVSRERFGSRKVDHGRGPALFRSRLRWRYSDGSSLRRRDSGVARGLEEFELGDAATVDDVHARPRRDDDQQLWALDQQSAGELENLASVHSDAKPCGEAVRGDARRKQRGNGDSRFMRDVLSVFAQNEPVDAALAERQELGGHGADIEE